MVDAGAASVEITDPFRDRGEFAAMLSMGFELPGWLAAGWLADWVPLPSDEDDDIDPDAPRLDPVY